MGSDGQHDQGWMHGINWENIKLSSHHIFNNIIIIIIIIINNNSSVPALLNKRIHEMLTLI